MVRTWTLGILCVLITVIFVGYAIYDHREDTLLASRSYMVNSVHYLNLDIERTFYGLNQTFKGIQNYLSAFSAAPQRHDVEPLLFDLIRENPYLKALLILDPDGNTKYSSGAGSLLSLRYNDCFTIHKTHQSEQLYVGRPVASQMAETPKWIFGVSKGIRDQSGALQSVMVAQIDLDFMKARFQGLALNPGASLIVSSLDDYVYLFLPDNDHYIGKYLPGLTLKNKQSNTVLVARRSNLKGEIEYFATRQVGQYPLFVTMTESEAGVMSNWKHSALSFLALGIGISAILLFMTLRVAKYQKKQHLIKEELRNLASTDPLTDLANRRYVLEQTTLEIRKAKRSEAPLSFILMDLDHFKEVNDSYGHDIGDMVLKETALILRKLCRESDIVSRYGGEEFLLVLPNTNLEGALSEAERIRAALARTSHWCQSKQFVVTASFGVSQWIPGEDDFENVLRRADDALYKVKNKGRNSIMSLPMANVTPLRKDFKQGRMGG